MNLFLTSVILELDLAPSRKTKTFFLILLNETHRVPKLQLNTMSAEKAFCINQYLLKVKVMNKALAQINVYNYFNIEDALVKLIEK